MAGGDAGGVLDRGSSGASPSPPLPPPSTEKATPSAVPPPPPPQAALPAGDHQGGGSDPPPPPPSLDGGEFLLHLLRRGAQSQANALPHWSSTVSGSGGGGSHDDPAVAAFGPSVPLPFPPPACGFPAAAASAPPVHARSHAPPPWAGYPAFPRAPWTAPPSELGPPRPPPPDFHRPQHSLHQHNSSLPGVIPALSPQVGFLFGPFVAGDPHRHPGHNEHLQQPRRDRFPAEGTPLIFGSLAGASNGSVPRCDPFPPDKLVSSSHGVQIRRDVLSAHSVAPSVSTGCEHEREKVLASRYSFVSNRFHESHQPKANQQLLGRWKEAADHPVQKQQSLSNQRSWEVESGRPLYGHKKSKDVKSRVPSSNSRNWEHARREQADHQSGDSKKLSCNMESTLARHLRVGIQLDQSDLPSGSRKYTVTGSDVKEHSVDLHFNNVSTVKRGEEIDDGRVEGLCVIDSNEQQNSSSEQLLDPSVSTDEIAETRVEVHVRSSRDKDYRSDSSRGHYVLSQRMRIRRRELQCRKNIAYFAPSFLAIYESLVPTEEEKAKQTQLLQSLEKLVIKEWPNARLYLYGSCANSFGVSHSDIDVCLAIDDNGLNKSEILLKLADILQSGNLQNVQALTRARVPIVKLMDPVTGISCDICVNNILAVVNTKLLRDYAQIDYRVRQLAFIVKHWAKSRSVNDTYQGTLSSYAYVLMCIHFLQLRKPAILPCLQGMRATYVVTVDDIECAFFDQVGELHEFGTENRENVAELLWAFFSYWAYHHDYANDVISVRTGGIISKQSKDWTRRIGNDRHLICIEDPFELSHDLGRVVDKYTIKILREEFERAAEIMQYHPDPGVTLFEPYVRVSEEDCSS